MTEYLPQSLSNHQSSPARSALTSVLLAFLCYVLFFHRLADRDLWSSHEARAAQDAQSILLDDQWGLPHLFDRQLELQKPPLYYWLVALIARWRGGEVDAWAVRLPATVSALLGVVLLCALGAARGRRLAGLLAATMMATALHYTWLARVGRIDMPLMLATGITLGAFYLGHHARRRGEGSQGQTWFLMAYVAAGLAVLLKGPIGLVLPAAVACVYLLAEGELPRSSRPRDWLSLANQYGLWWGMLVAGAIALPWYLWANAQTHGQLFRVFFWKHNVERGFGGGTLASHPWWFYGPQFFFDSLPWSVLLPIATWFVFKRRWWRDDAEARFGLIWLVIMIAVLSCSKFKRADYLLPAYPGAALFLGCVAERRYRQARYQRALTHGFFLIVGGCALGWWIYLGREMPARESRLELRTFAREVRRRAPNPQLVLFFRAEAHALAFHVGRPIATVLEWENLDVWAGRPEMYYVVMPPDCARDWGRHLKCGKLKEVLRTPESAEGTHSRPLVLLRTHPEVDPSVP